MTKESKESKPHSAERLFRESHCTLTPGLSSVDAAGVALANARDMTGAPRLLQRLVMLHFVSASRLQFQATFWQGG